MYISDIFPYVKKLCRENIRFHNLQEATDSCHRDGCFSSRLSAWRVTSWGPIRSSLSPAVKPAWLHIKSTGTGISAHGGNGRATWSLCQESGVKTHFSPPVWGPWGQTWSQQSQHIPPCWQLPSDLAFTLQTVRLGITHHLPKDGVASLAPLQKHSASKGAQDRVFLLSVSPGVNGEASLTLV